MLRIENQRPPKPLWWPIRVALILIVTPLSYCFFNLALSKGDPKPLLKPCGTHECYDCQCKFGGKCHCVLAKENANGFSCNNH